MKAVRANTMDTVRYLLDKGADPGVADGRGNTALVHAVLQGNPGIAALLIQGGANVYAVTGNGATPLRIAKRVRNAAANMNAKMDMDIEMHADMKSAGHFPASHPVRTKDQALKLTKEVLQLLANAGATLDQQPIQRTEAQRHERHEGRH